MSNIQDTANIWINTRDEKDFEVLYNTIKPGLMNYVNCMISDKQLSDSIIADAFINVILKIDSYDDKYAFSTWVYKIANNIAIRQIKRQNKYHLSGGMDLCDDGAKIISFMDIMKYRYTSHNHNDDAHVLVPNDEKIDVIRVYLHKIISQIIINMKPMYRDIMIDSKLRGESNRTIAKRYDMNINTVKTRIHTGMKMVKNAINNDHKDVVEKYKENI